MTLKVLKHLERTQYFEDAFGVSTYLPQMAYGASGTGALASVYRRSNNSWYGHFTKSFSQPGMAHHDFDFADSGPGGILASSGAPTGDFNNEGLLIGQWDKFNGIQRVYWGAGTLDWQEVNPINHEFTGAVPFTGMFAVGTAHQTNGRISTENGFWEAPDDLAVNGHMILFEGAGYAIKLGCDVRTGTIGGTGGAVYQNVAAIVHIDPNTGSTIGGDAVSIADVGECEVLDLPLYYDSTAVNEFTRPQLFGEDVSFVYGQYVEDEDATYTKPKGFLFLCSRWATFDNGPPIRKECWVKVVDWNPDNTEGSPSRIHLRERFVSRVRLTTGTTTTWEDAADGINVPMNSSTQQVPIWHSGSNRIRMFGWQSAGSSAPYPSGTIVELQWVPVAETFSITSPSMREARAEVDSTRLFESQVHGDLGEIIAGESVTFSLSKMSVTKEAITTTNTALETVTVARPPIDDQSLLVYVDDILVTEGVIYNNVDLDDGTFDMILGYVDGRVTATYSYKRRGSLDVVAEDIVTTNMALETVFVKDRYTPLKADTLVLYRDAAPGVPLVQFIDYDNIDLAAGSVRLLLTEVNGTITADYTVARPTDSYGTLLTPAVLSDDDGRATTRVQYADDADLLGEFDDLEARTPDTV